MIHLLYFIHRGNPWPSLPLRLFRGFMAIWNGLYYVNKRGSHLFRFTVAGSLRVTINSQICSTKRVSQSINSNIYECTYAFTTVGYYPLTVSYIYTGQESGIQFFVKLPDTSQYVNPKNYVFTEIDEVFRYSSKQMICVVNTTIAFNSPIFNTHVPSSFTYTSIPPLPAGLSISNGVIVGIPTKIADSENYTIIATSHDTILSTIVTIEVQPAEIPSSILVYDLLGRIYTSLSVFQYAFIPPLKLKSDVDNVLWRFTPSLPTGILLDNQESCITGRAHTLFKNTTLLLEAQASGGKFVMNFPVEVKGCEYGQFLYTSFSDYSRGTIIVKDNDMIIYNEDIITSDYGLVMCLQKKNYDIEILCNNLDYCVFNLFREDGLCLLMKVIPPAKWNYYTLEEEDINPPLIIMKTPTVVTRVNLQFHVYFMVEHPYYELVFHPALPSSIQFDQHRLRLYGFYPSSAVLQFTVTTHNDYGSHELPFSIYVDHCSGNSQLFRISRYSSELSESMRIIFNQSTNIIHEILFSGEPYDNYVCLELKTYTVILEDSLAMGWVPGSDVVIRDYLNRTYTTLLLDANHNNITDLLDLQPILKENSSMKYLISVLAPSSFWKTLIYDDTNWLVNSSPHWNTIPASLATVYFRSIVSIDTGSLAIHIFFKEGCIVYIDGVELDRFNLPEGVIYHSTTASSQFISNQWITLFSPYYSSSRQVIVAVEIHRFNVVASSSITFDLFITHNLSPQLLVSFEGQGIPFYAFDGKRSHFWNSSLPAHARYTFANNHHYAINRIDIAVGPLFQWNVPSVFNVYGRNSQSELVATFSSKSFFHQPYDVVSLSLASLKRFSEYDIIFSSSLNNQSINIHAIAFYLTTTINCQGDNHWPTTKAGTIATGTCHSCMVGKSHRECTRNSLTGIWNEPSYSTCISKTPLLGVLYLDTTLQVFNITESLWSETIEDLFQKIIMKRVQVDINHLVFLPYGDCSTEEALLFEVGIRIEVKKKYKSEVYWILLDIKDIINEELHNQGISFTSIQSAEVVQIHDSTLVVILFCILCVLVIGLVIGIYLIIKQWKKKQMHVSYNQSFVYYVC